MLGVSTAIAILAYLGFYAYFAFKDPDALRSERYSIQKLALEKGFVGDSTTGDVKLRDITPGDPVDPGDPPDKELMISDGGERA